MSTHKLRLTLAIAALGMSSISCSGQNLNPFRGAMKDLLPDTVGAYKRETVLPQHRTPQTKFEEGLGATYKNSSAKESLDLLALNFFSAEKAREGWHDYERECQGNGGKTRDETPTKKSTSGKILVCTEVGHPGLAWTNGSVLFIIFTDAELGGSAAQALAFERKFPY
jgi:hypothetical protein